MDKLNEISEKLKNLTIFEGFDDVDRYEALKLLNAREKSYDEDEIIFEEGEKVRFAGVVTSGCVHAAKYYLDGSRAIINSMHAVNLFGEALFFSDGECIENGVYAGENCSVVLLDFSCLDLMALKNIEMYGKLTGNLLRELSAKVLSLMDDKQIITQRTTAEKLMSFLRREAIRAGSRRFRIRYSRQELADFLGVDRSSMITEIGRLKNAGMIEVNGKEFSLSDEQ